VDTSLKREQIAYRTHSLQDKLNIACGVGNVSIEQWRCKVCVVDLGIRSETNGHGARCKIF
jgi:hypothetical protein